jgi:hypothetical protein
MTDISRTAKWQIYGQGAKIYFQVLDYFGKDENVGKCEKCNHDLRLGSLTISQSLSQAVLGSYSVQLLLDYRRKIITKFLYSPHSHLFETNKPQYLKLLQYLKQVWSCMIPLSYSAVADTIRCFTTRPRLYQNC